MRSVVIVGAGLAGLNCAQVLSKKNYRVTILESTDRVGGRIKSDYIDGFTCDHGFQVINPKYSELQKTGVVPELQMHSLPKGFDISINGREFRVGDFRKHLRYLPGDLSSQTGSMREKLNFIRFLAFPGEERPLSEALESSGSFYRRVLKGFLDGVFLTDSDQVSSEMAQELLRWFAQGSPGVPRNGVAALPTALQKNLDIQLNSEVIQVKDGSVRTNTEEISSDFIVVATDAIAGRKLLGGDNVAMNYSATWYHAIDSDLISSKYLRVARKPPLINSIVISNVAPSYAPEGKSLISSTTLRDITSSEADSAVSELWGINGSEMEVVARYEIPNSLPRHLPGKGLQGKYRLSEKVFIAGDDRTFPAQQGALLSGRLVAEAIIADQ
jgi:phytoene dehydrogenase-like protein